MAKDRGEPSASSETTLVVNILDVNDNEPEFPMRVSMSLIASHVPSVLCVCCLPCFCCHLMNSGSVVSSCSRWLFAAHHTVVL